ncbi:MAG: SapC family protein [Betaproteobacteria bacterium]|nr:SapC family protein [Betaproteobacteria bacterium]
MQINPPFGYREIVPFYKNNRVRLPAPGALPDFARDTNAIPVSYTEFAVACRDYPLVFTSTDGGKTFAAIAVVGVAAGENLFLTKDGWQAGVYIPAYVRRYPFCMARVTLDKVEQADRLVCVERAFVADDGERMFDDAGAPLERWTHINKLLNEFESDLERSREMCGILADYALLAPFTMQATGKDGAPLNLAGMYRVEEKKLEVLNAAQHKNLFKKGIVGRIYAHLLSLDNFARLLARKGAGIQAPPAAAPAAGQPKG